MWETFGFVDALGVAGSLMICAAYMAATRGWADPEATGYNLVNAAGSILLLISLYYTPNAGAILIEVLWLAIALSAIARGLGRRRRRQG